jgi:hypothetical protein
MPKTAVLRHARPATPLVADDTACDIWMANQAEGKDTRLVILVTGPKLGLVTAQILLAPTKGRAIANQPYVK